MRLALPQQIIANLFLSLFLFLLLASHLLAVSMAWVSSGRSNRELVQNLLANGVFRSNAVALAMQQVDRADYVPNHPYEDAPQGIGHQQTISAPHMHAEALERLVDKATLPGAKVLDVGSGSGYMCACFAHLNPSAKVIGIDRIDSLVDLAISNVKKHDSELLESGRVEIHSGDGWAGWPAQAPFNVIHVGAAAEDIPKALLSQLSIGGRMIIPVGPQSSHQTLLMIDRIGEQNSEKDFQIQRIVDVRYVPLVRDL